MSEKIIKIVCAGDDSFSKLYHYQSNEMIIAVDGGFAPLIALGIKADIGIGDFDSFEIEDAYKNAIEIIKFPKEKDYSDLELALKLAISQDASQILVYNAIGARQDHFLAAVKLLINYSEYNIILLDERNQISITDTKTFTKNEMNYISFFAITPNTVITLEGFKYSLKDYSLAINDCLCISNEITNQEATITTNNKVLVIRSK